MNTYGKTIMDFLQNWWAVFVAIKPSLLRVEYWYAIAIISLTFLIIFIINQIVINICTIVYNIGIIISVTSFLIQLLNPIEQRDISEELMMYGEEGTLINEEYVKTLKDFFQNWRAVFVALQSILLWEDYWHSLVIITFTVLILLLVNLSLINTLTIIFIISMIINITNYLMPILHHHIEPTWTSDQDQIYEEICFNIVAVGCNAADFIKHLYTLRMEKPLFFFPIIIGVQLVVFWTTLYFNNNLIICIVTTLLLWPGIKRQYNRMIAY